GSVPFHGLQAGARTLLLLVQRSPTAHATQDRDPGRDLLPSASRCPSPALRAASAMVTSRSVRLTPNAHPRAARCPAGSRRLLSQRTPASADRDAQARGVEAVQTRG